MNRSPWSRRSFLHAAVSGVGACCGAAWPVRPAAADPHRLGDTDLMAGQGVVDITPPLGITMGGFHFTPDNRRVIEGVRGRSFARVLLMQVGGTEAVLVSLPLLNASRDFVEEVQQAIGRAIGVPPLHVRVCASHTHSMPTVAFNRQWGDQHPEYLASVVAKLTTAARDARQDQSPAALYVGRAVAEQANANRTAAVWKNEDEFGPDATDEDRWLDRRVHVLHFERPTARHNLLWYHFSAHPTCFTDRQCGPDWPGVVEEDYHAIDRIHPAFLQGHIGDVSPGGGGLGNAAHTSFHLCKALPEALVTAKRIRPEELRIASRPIDLPIDLDLFNQQIDEFESNPQPAGSFEQDWYANFATKYDQSQQRLPTTIAALRLGDLAMVFQPSELYSYYGLAIERASTARFTIVVGYAEDYIGYLPDPRAFRDKEYAAIVVPRILNYPPFATDSAQALVDEAAALLQELA